MKPTQKATGHVRIISGVYRSQLIPVVTHDGLRPSADRVRETVFNWMAHQWGGVFEGKAILDGFAGSGAFGLECISRGASDVVMLDTHAPTVAHIAHTLQKWQASARVYQQDILLFLSQYPKPLDWIILDPPFGHSWLDQVIPAIMPLTHDDTWLYIEVEKNADVSALNQHGWIPIREGKTQQVRYGLWRRA